MTIHDLFAKQLEQERQVTQETIDWMKAGRKTRNWTEKAIEEYFEGVVPGVTKQVYYVLDRSEDSAIDLLSCWDFQIPMLEERCIVSRWATNDGMSTDGSALPRLEEKTNR